MGLALASSLASYLNLWQLWRALRRDGIYRPQPGWILHSARLAAGCGALVIVLIVGLSYWPEWNLAAGSIRIWRLFVLIVLAASAFAAAMGACGYRWRDLHSH